MMLMEVPLRSPPALYGSEVPRRARPNGGGEDPPAGAVGQFQMALDASRHMTQATILSPNSKASPSQMFEPNTADAHDRRQAALKKADESARPLDVETDRMDTTSVKARRAAAGDSGDTMNAARGRGSSGLSSEQVGVDRAGRGSEATPGDLMKQHGVGQEVSSGSGAAIDRSETATRARAWHTALAPDAGDGAGSKATGVSDRLETGAAGAAESMSAAAGSAQVSAGGHAQGNTAQEIAQSLSAVRVGQVESARAVSSTPMAENAGPHAGRQRSANAAAPSRSGREDPTLRHARESGTMREARFERLVRSIRLQTGGRFSSAQVRLDPPELGRIQVDVRMDGDRLQVRVRTQTAEARELLSRRATQLRAALASHGIHVERFDVVADFPGNEPVDPNREERSRPAASTWGRGRRGGMGASTNVGSSDDTAEGVEADGAKATGAVKEARLDILV